MIKIMENNARNNVYKIVQVCQNRRLQNVKEYVILCLEIRKAQDMAKNNIEVDEISTTDKLKALKTLKDAGFRVEFNGSGVPIVVCQRTEDMDKELKNVKKALKELRYNGSFGVRGPRKSDSISSDAGREVEISEVEVEETDNNEILTA